MTGISNWCWTSIWIVLCYCSLLDNVDGSSSSSSSFQTTKSHDPFEKLPKHFWHEISSPFTDMPDDDFDEEPEETTPTQDPYPFFDEPNIPSNVTAQLGSNVNLHCRVNDLRNRTVSWIRKNGDSINLITFADQKYSNDSKYSLKYEAPNDWQLFIQYANEKDEGLYECTVSSHPPIAHLINLVVVVPRIEIVDERGLATPDKYYKAGSTIELKCVISKVQSTKYVQWKHGVRILNSDISRGGISVKSNRNSGGAISRLYIANANRLDSGNYTCSLPDIAQTTVTVHVLNGENPAAMQHGGATRWTPIITIIVLDFFALMVTQR